MRLTRSVLIDDHFVARVWSEADELARSGSTGSAAPLQAPGDKTHARTRARTRGDIHRVPPAREDVARLVTTPAALPAGGEFVY